MAPNNFVFPPPPPPPPPQSSYQSYPTYPSNQSRNGFDSGYPRNGTQRGRGQANGFRASPFPRGNISQRQNYDYHGSRQQGTRGSHAPQNSPPMSVFRGPTQIQSEAFRGGFRRDRPTATHATASPAVPRFGLPLPSKQVSTPEVLASARKRKREHNQLGLTPKQEEHVSSEEDIDEEERLARSMPTSGESQLSLQFTYKGRSSTLNSASELAAWLAERKKRYPTRARAEEEKLRRSKQQEEARLARSAKQEQERKEKEQQKIQLARLKVEESIRKKQQQQEDHPTQGNKVNREEKAIQRAEKLRKKYEKAQEKVSQLTALKSSPKIMTEGDLDPNLRALREQSMDDLVVAGYAAQGLETGSFLTPTSQTHSPVLNPKVEVSDITERKSDSGLAVGIEDGSGTIRHEASACGDPENTDTSHSTSSESDSETSSQASSDDEDESSGPDAAPPQLSSKGPSSEQIDAPILPPPKRMKNEICRSFLTNGRCPLKGRCRYKHELPERGTLQREKEKQNVGGGKSARTKLTAPRMSLYQRMVEQEKEQEAQAIIEHIIYLGEHGFLDSEAKE